MFANEHTRLLIHPRNKRHWVRGSDYKTPCPHVNSTSPRLWNYRRRRTLDPSQPSGIGQQNWRKEIRDMSIIVKGRHDGTLFPTLWDDLWLEREPWVGRSVFPIHVGEGSTTLLLKRQKGSNLTEKVQSSNGRCLYELKSFKERKGEKVRPDRGSHTRTARSRTQKI